MNEILQMLRSPGWWFSVVLIGGLIGILVVFIQDGMRTLMKMLWKRVSSSRANRKEEEAKYISFLVQNPDLITAELQMCLLGFVKVLIMIVMQVMMLCLILFKKAFPDAAILSILHFYDVISPTGLIWIQIGMFLLAGSVLIPYFRWYGISYRAYFMKKKERAKEWIGSEPRGSLFSRFGAG